MGNRDTHTEPARLLIADDHALVREGLRTMLSGEDDIQVIAEVRRRQGSPLLLPRAAA